MNKNNTNIINFIPKKYGSYIFDETIKYQKIYNFDIGTGEHATWNNEADAFKHAFMQAQLALWTGKHISKKLGEFHEYQGNKFMGQSKGEYNMDTWNNRQGREIAQEILQQYGILSTIPSEKINDITAKKIIQRMKEGKLILSPKDKRNYKNYNCYNTPTGQAAPIENTKSQLSGYTNPLTGNNRIFTREDVGAMTPEEFAKYEKEIDAQTEFFNGTMPTNEDLQREAFINGEVIYVNSYTRADGTYVKGYYRTK